MVEEIITGIDLGRSRKLSCRGPRRLKNASYLIFKNLYLSWNVPSKWVKTLGLQGLSLQGSVDNLFTLTGRKGMNPQYSFTGTQDATYVSARAFNLGVNIKF